MTGRDHLWFFIAMLAFFIYGSRAHAETMAAIPGSTYEATQGANWQMCGSHWTGTSWVSDGCATVWDAASNSNHATTACIHFGYGAWTSGSSCGGSGAYPGGGQVSVGSPSGVVYQCTGAAATLSGTTCTTPDSCPGAGGWTLSGDQCTRAEACSDGQVISSGYYDIGTSPTASIAGGACSGGSVSAPGCWVTFEGSSPAASRLVNGVRHYYAQGSYSASPVGDTVNCDPGEGASAPSSSALPQDSCGAGKKPGVINGSTVCFSLTDGTVAGGTVTTSQTTTTTDSNGTTTSVTTNADGTVSTTVTDSAGNSTTTKTGAPSPVSSFSGSCASAFVCEGDPVQCATAKELHRHNCVIEAESPQSELGQQVVAGADPVANPAAPGQREIVAMPEALDTSRRWAASCPEDFEFTLGGQAVTVPFSVLCSPLQMMGQIVVALTLVAGARIALGD